MIIDTRINTYTTSDQGGSSIAALDDGGFVVTWSSNSQDGDGAGIYAQRYDANGVVQGSEFRVNGSTTGDQANSSITAIKNGGFVVNWMSARQDDIDSGIYVQRYDANGMAQGSEFRVNAHVPRDLSVPIAALDDGGFVVAWRYEIYREEGDEFRISAQRYDANGVAQGNEFRVNTTTTGFHGEPSIAALTNGGFVVSWTSYDHGLWNDQESFGIYAQRYDTNGVAQGSEFYVNPNTFNDQHLSLVAALKDGGFVVTWSSIGPDGDDIDGYAIYAQRYDASGVAQGNEFRVNTTTIGYQGNPSIAALNDGGFVVTWTSESQDDSTSGIYGKRYDANGNEVEWIDPAALPFADRLFNWAESIHTNLFPNHPPSQEIEGYYARLYESGNALGEQNDNIYFYDGHSIVLVGTVNDFLPDAIAAGF